MVSFGITALFTSIDIPQARETLATLLKEQDPSDTISTENMLKLLDLCLMTHFVFNDHIYEQINGTPVGSPISGLIAESVMQRLENMALCRSNPNYGSDTWTTLLSSANGLNEKKPPTFNHIFTGIKFTREEEKNKQFPFPDVMVERRANEEFLTKVHRKATH
eukprot:g42709.t1